LILLINSPHLITVIRLLPQAPQLTPDTLNLSESTLARQKQIVTASLALLDEVAASHEYTRPKLLAFVRAMAPLVTENVTEATRAQLDAIHAQVSAWRSNNMTPREWNQLHVLIIGPHMPREGYVATQYFLRLLNEPAEGRRVVFAEALWDEPRALDLFGTHLLDGDIGEGFFGDYMRMHRDLLGDAAKEYLPRLLSK
jgi:hypothetical protein